MVAMTKHELREFYRKKAEVFNLEQTALGLQAYLETISGQEYHRDLVESIRADIAELEKKIAQLNEEEALLSDRVKATLSKVEDDTARICLMLHYYEGLEWKQIEAILRKKHTALRNNAARHLNYAGIK